MSPRLSLPGTDIGVSTTIARGLFLVLVILFVLPSVASALTYTPLADSTSSSSVTSENLTFVSTQGTSTAFAAGIYAINTETKEVMWSYTGCPKKCFDIDLVGNNEIVFVSKTAKIEETAIDSPEEYPWKATMMNWRTGKILEQFAVPYDTHDVDYIGNGKYLIAGKGVPGRVAGEAWVNVTRTNGWLNQTQTDYPDSDVIYIFDAKTDEIVWTYYFQKYYPATAGSHEGRSHLNDVQLVKNGSAILASPRDYDRVVLINRNTKETVWTLGEEDNYSILYEQHNPDLLSTNPPTVLVADSENDRIIEYKKEGDEWVVTWTYSGELDWPRDADRLPNGNTLIVDSKGDRVIVVTPQKEVVWEMDISKHPYDAERLGLTDEPTGPPMHTLLNNTSASETQDSRGATGALGTLAGLWDKYYGLSGWVFPPWMDQFSFVSLHFAVLSLFGWGGFEWKRWRS